ncbi:hypothetical protein ElyMa_000452500 [Elysia marginata]|uniref:Uncharacterized protein n=1 Tax=Elysia marginata TaxID=1093978 RepID=A0AAV4FSZ4_9GAST|nr:hypothetical protein ElyMa_000452500 [Elysia marginata]
MVRGLTSRSTRSIPHGERVDIEKHQVSSVFLYTDRLCGLAVRHSLRDREAYGSMSSRVKPRTLRLIRLVSGIMDLVPSLVGPVSG